MEFSFQLNTIATVGAELARKATKRKRDSAAKDHEPVKQQKFNNGLPFTANSPPQCNRERNALKEEEEIFEQPAPKHDCDLTTMSSSQTKRKRDSAAKDHEPVKQQKFNNGLPFTANSPPQCNRERNALKEEEEVFEQQSHKHVPELTTTSSSQEAKRKRLSTIEDQAPSKQQKLNDGSPLSTSPQSNGSLHFLAGVDLSNSKSRSSFSSKTTSGTSTPADVASSSSTSRSSTPARAERSKGGRPRADKQFPRQKQLRVRTKLRINRPVKNEIPCEIWQSILEFCPSEFLLKAVTIDYFKDILRRNENSWKVARLRQFGHDMPDPPPGTSELEYAELLTGSGCQGCGDKLTRRQYWGFQKRWCDICLVDNVAPVKILEKEYAERCERDPEDGNFFHKLVECIPGVRYDSWNHYQWVGDYEAPPSWAKTYPNGQNLRFSRASFKEMDTKVRTSSLNSSSTEEEIEAFFEPYITENKAFVSKLQAIEGWWMTFRREKKSEVAALKENRESNFKARALRMDPPLLPEVLELCPSYHRAKNIAGPFTDKVWSVLKSKLVVERDAADAELAKNRWLKDINKYRQQMRVDQAENMQRRENNSSPEQLFVLGLADAVITDLESILMENAIAAEDIIHVFFRRVYDAYESSTMKPQGKNGDYRLIMDDARMVEEEKLKPFLRRHGLRSARKVKCPGCMNTNEIRTMTDQMQHIVEYHYYHDSHRGDDDLCHMVHYPCYQNVFQWVFIEWPRNMPMIAPHHFPTGSWDFRDRIDYRLKQLW